MVKDYWKLEEMDEDYEEMEKSNIVMDHEEYIDLRNRITIERLK